MTNILRDLDEDAGLGRLYLPREALAEAGIARGRHQEGARPSKTWAGLCERRHRVQNSILQKLRQ